jgi:chloramphenicol 3-O-phosphotransferase
VAWDGTVPNGARRGQEAVHRPGIYDLEVDASLTRGIHYTGMIDATLRLSRPTDSRVGCSI